jgi:hypothetical protein
MYLGDDPGATIAATVFMTILGLAFAAVAFAAYQPLFAPRRARSRHAKGSSARSGAHAAR